MRTIGHVEALYRYPIKSMAGESLPAAQIGWYGIDGDRRFARRRRDEPGGMPWLTASRLPALLQFTPVAGADGVATHVRTPDGRELAVRSEELAAEIARLHGKPVQMMRLDHGIFDETPLSLIATSTIRGIGELCGRTLEPLRFRPNILVRTEGPTFEDDAWVGGIATFGDDGPELAITYRDERCAMLNLDHRSAESHPEVLKAVVRVHENLAGVYATVTRRGRIAVGQPIYLR